MSKIDKLVAKILSRTSDANISFERLCQLLRRLGFEERIRGSHHIFVKEESQAKAYQVGQIREVILKYHLGGKDDAAL